jgi:hypothetical protein
VPTKILKSFSRCQLAPSPTYLRHLDIQESMEGSNACDDGYELFERIGVVRFKLPTARCLSNPIQYVLVRSDLLGGLPSVFSSRKGHPGERGPETYPTLIKRMGS